MGILTNFSNYSSEYDIIGAVALHHFIREKERLPGKSSLRREKTRDLTQWITPDFIGSSFAVLIRTMNAYCITFELYYDDEVLVTNGHKPQLRLLTKSVTECTSLSIALSPLDIWTPPKCLKKPKGPIDSLKSYVTRLDEVSFMKYTKVRQSVHKMRQSVHKVRQRVHKVRQRVHKVRQSAPQLRQDR